MYQTKRTGRDSLALCGIWPIGAPPASNAAPVPTTEPAAPFAPFTSMTCSRSTTAALDEPVLVIDVDTVTSAFAPTLAGLTLGSPSANDPHPGDGATVCT